MVRVGAVFVAACMVLICASFGAVLHLTFGLAAPSPGGRDRGADRSRLLHHRGEHLARPLGVAGQIVELSRGIADLARQVVELGRRVGAIENKLAEAVERAEAATEPLSAEIGEIGVLIKQLAEFGQCPRTRLAERQAAPRRPARLRPRCGRTRRRTEPAPSPIGCRAG